MEYTGINKDKEEFVPRKSKEDFFRDGEIIKELYNWTSKTMCVVENKSSDELTLCVFNYAYRICWIKISKKMSIKRIDNFMTFENDTVRMHSWAVAYALLRLNNKFHPFKDVDRIEITMLLPRYFYDRYYYIFVKSKSLSHPISFRASFSEEEQITEVDLAKTRKHILAAMDKAIKLEEENKELGKQLEEERRKREIAEQTVEGIQTKLNCLENDAFYKAVNINSILKYAQDKGNCDNNDIKTIRMMLLALCANKVPNDVIEAIKTLKLGGNITIGEQHNHGCQNFYGNITDSEFPSK